MGADYITAATMIKLAALVGAALLGALLIRLAVVKWRQAGKTLDDILLDFALSLDDDRVGQYPESPDGEAGR